MLRLPTYGQAIPPELGWPHLMEGSTCNADVDPTGEQAYGRSVRSLCINRATAWTAKRPRHLTRGVVAATAPGVR